VNSGSLVRLVATVVVIVFAVGIWGTGGKPTLEWLHFFSAAVLISTGLMWLWETILWKLPMAQRYRAVPRDVGGTWKGTLESFWKDPATGAMAAPKPAYLVVRQTASTVSVVLLTDESRSVSSLAAVSNHSDLGSLDYLYLNRPDSRLEDRSRIHHGSTTLDITGRPATRLRGHYWTDRESKGELDFAQRTKRAADDFTQASTFFDVPTASRSRQPRRSKPR
jgi:hypothetical protein